MQLGSDVALDVMQAPHAALLRPFTQELPCATGVALKRKKIIIKSGHEASLKVFGNCYDS